MPKTAWKALAAVTFPGSRALETNRVAAVHQQRNLSDCKSSLESCDYSKLTASDSKELARTEHQRNYAACRNGYGYCDLSQLTAAEVRSLPAEHAPRR
jgi:heterodisulfide reductase subunit A-like polyferredoxin